METKGKAGVFRAAGLLMAAGILSRILGYLRDVIIATAYGQTRITDAYQAAFSIPDFLYNLLVAGTVTAAFIPVFSGYINTDRQEEGWAIAATVFHVAAVVMFCGVAAAWTFTPAIVSNWLVPGFEPDSMALTVTMTRIMLLQAFFMALNGIGMGILHSYQRFMGPAVASVAYNIVIIFFGVALKRYLGIVGFAVGVTVGAAAQFIIQLISLKQIGLRYKPVLLLNHPGVRQVFALMIPILLSYGLTQIGLLVQQNIASALPGGALSALRWAQRLMLMPVSIFAVTMIIAIFPTLNSHVARREMDLFKSDIVFGLRNILYITLPCSVGLAVLSQPVVRLLYQQGNFSAESTALTAYTLTFFCFGLFAQGGVLLMNRVFYALQDTWKPVLIGLCAMALNILLNYLFISPMGTGGLALAYSCATIVNLLMQMQTLRRKIGRIGARALCVSFGKTLVISAIMGLCAYAAAWATETWWADVQTKAGQLAQVGVALLVGVLVYFGLSLALGMEETGMIRAWGLSRLQRIKEFRGFDILNGGGKR